MSSDSCLRLSDPRLVGDPVDTCSGAVFDRKLEFRLTGPLELWWYRHYNSAQCHRSFALGWGHTHEFDRALRFHGDRFSYEAPVGLVFDLPALIGDGETGARDGFVLRRCSSRRYQLSHHGEPEMEFEFRQLQAQAVARLGRLFQGQHQVVFHYNPAGLLDRIVDSAGRVISVVEGKDGRLKSLTLEAGHGEPGSLLMSYEYDSAGNLIRTRNAAGHGHTFVYDSAHRLLQVTGRKGFQFRFQYDEAGRCTKASGDDQLYAVALNYKTPGRLTKVTRFDGGEWSYTFDKSGGLTRVVDPLGGVQKFVRDERGRVMVEVDPNGNCTCFVYDDAGAAIAKLDPLGHRFDLPEDPNAPDPYGHRVAATPAEYEYGRLLDLSSISLPAPVKVATLPLQPDARAFVVVRTESPDLPANDSEFEVRPLGFLWWPDPRRGRRFNALGKLVQQCDDLGRVRQWTYDNAGNPGEFIDFDGGKWSYDYGSWHFLRGIRNPLGAAVRFTHTPNGDVAACVDPGQTRTEYRYDLKDQLIEVRRHGVVREAYTRDAVGNLLAKHASDGRELLRFEIGPGNLPVRRVLASGDEHNFAYDESGRELVAATKKDHVEFAYDGLGNRVLEKRNGRGVVHQFRGWQRPTGSVIFDRFAVHYEWPSDDTLAIIDPTGKGYEIRLLAHGLIERLMGNGRRETAQYDNLGRCLFKCLRRWGGDLWCRRYHWSGEGELRRVEDNILGETRHEYDLAHRLRRRYVQGRVEDYELDVADNLMAQPGLTGVALTEGNRLKTANGWTFGYNDRNHVAVRQSAGSVVHYTYDSRDQLIRVESPTGVWEAEYDALGRRTRKTWANETSEYFWNTDQLIAEVRADGRLRLYVYADPLALTPVLFLDYDSVDAQPESGRRYVVLTDQIGAPSLIEDATGIEVWRGRLAPYGRMDIDAGSQVEFNFRFPGHYWDAEVELHYNRFRYLDPALGRYLQSDPSGIAGGVNLYGYSTNPLLVADVRGLGEDKDDKKLEDPKKKTGDDEKKLPLATRAAADAEQKKPSKERAVVMAGMKTPDGEVTTGGSYRGPREEYKGLEGAPKTKESYDKAAAEVRQPPGLTDEQKKTWPAPEQSGRCGEAQRMADHERKTGEMPPPGTEFHADKVRGENSPAHGEDIAACPYCSKVMDDKGYKSSSGTTPYDTAPPAASSGATAPGDAGAAPASGTGGSPAPPSSGSPPSGGGGAPGGDSE
jgi:RHS repeat-associated protein